MLVHHLGFDAFLRLGVIGIAVSVLGSDLELHVGRDGVDINPLQLFPSDLHGPVNVAQRVADTFGRVYKKIGVLNASSVVVAGDGSQLDVR